MNEKTVFKFVAKETGKKTNADFQSNQMAKLTTEDGDIILTTERGFKNFFEKNIKIELLTNKEG